MNRFAKGGIFFIASLLMISLMTGCDSFLMFNGSDGDGETDGFFNNPENEDLYDVLMAGVDTSNGNLRLSEIPSTFPFIWIANSAEGTISKLSTETGEELGRYRTGPNGSADNPSRTTVDLNGNVWVGNRGNNTATKVGLLEGGQCIDRNGNGVIDTSRPAPGDPDVLGWGNDECVLLHVALTATGITTPTNIRLVAIDPDNNLFLGGTDGITSLFKVDGVTGDILDAVMTEQDHYGGVVDNDGTLWSMSSGSGNVEKISNDMQTTELIALGHGGYGITIDLNGLVWTTALGGGQFSSFDPADPAGTLQVYSKTGADNSQGIASDSNGDIFIAGSLWGTVVSHHNNDGTFVANYTVGNGPTGVAIDAAGNVWSANINSNNASRINLDTGQIDSFPVGQGPYNYSDMTGTISRTITTIQGTWNATFDGETDDYNWDRVIWELRDQGNLPLGTGLTVMVRAANLKADLGGEAYEEVLNDVALEGIVGRYLQVEIKLFTDDPAFSEEVTDLIIF